MTNKTKKYLKMLNPDELVFIIEKLQKALYDIRGVCFVKEYITEQDAIDTINNIMKEIKYIDNMGLCNFLILKKEDFYEMKDTIDFLMNRKIEKPILNVAEFIKKVKENKYERTTIVRNNK